MFTPLILKSLPAVADPLNTVAPLWYTLPPKLAPPQTCNAPVFAVNVFVVGNLTTNVPLLLVLPWNRATSLLAKKLPTPNTMSLVLPVESVANTKLPPTPPAPEPNT